MAPSMRHSGSRPRAAAVPLVFMLLCIASSLAAPAGLSSPYSSLHSFAYITDLHYADRDPVNLYQYRQALEKARAAVDHFNFLQDIRGQTFDFMVFNGDLKDINPLDADLEGKALEYLRDIEAELKRFQGKTYHVIGNHDIDVITKQQFLENVVNSDIPVEQGRYYSFTIGTLHYIVLDANFYGDGTDHAYTSIDPNYKWNEVYISKEEIDWLQKDLAQNRDKNVIVFCHQRLDANEPAPGYLTVKNAPEVRAVLESHKGVLAVFHGHDHSAPGSPSTYNGIHYYVLKAAVDRPFPENSFALVDIYANCTIDVVGFSNAVPVRFAKEAQTPCLL